MAVGWLLTFPLSIALALFARLILPEAAQPEFALKGPLAFGALVVFAPVVETLIMGAVLLILTALVRREVAVLVSAVGWGVAHSTMAPMWGLVIWWPFLIFSILFVTWRQRSLSLAFLVPMGAHALQNLLPALMIAFGEPG